MSAENQNPKSLLIILIAILSISVAIFLYESYSLEQKAKTLQDQIDTINKNNGFIVNVINDHSIAIRTLGNYTRDQLQFNSDVEDWANTIESRMKTNP